MRILILEYACSVTLCLLVDVHKFSGRTMRQLSVFFALISLSALSMSASADQSAEVSIELSMQKEIGSVSITGLSDIFIEYQEGGANDFTNWYSSDLMEFCVRTHGTRFYMTVEGSNDVGRDFTMIGVGQAEPHKILYRVRAMRVLDVPVPQLLYDMPPGEAKSIAVSQDFVGSECDSGGNIGLELRMNKYNSDEHITNVAEALSGAGPHEFVDTLTLTLSPHF